MPNLHVRNVPDDLYERLKQRARAEGRSLSAQTVVLLRDGLEREPLGAREALRRLEQRRVKLPPGEPLSEELIREDRDSR